MYILNLSGFDYSNYKVEKQFHRAKDVGLTLVQMTTIAGSQADWLTDN